MIPRNANALAIDPGYAKKSKGCACAVAFSGILTRVWFERARDFLGKPGEVDLDFVIAEQPQQDGRSWSVPPAVLIKLAWEGAKLAGLYAGAGFAELRDPTVADWKGSEAKPAMHRRLWQVLSLAEMNVLGGAATGTRIRKACEAAALKRWAPGNYYGAWDGHNLLDAAALLMCELGRLKKVG